MLSFPLILLIIFAILIALQNGIKLNNLNKIIGGTNLIDNSPIIPNKSGKYGYYIHPNNIISNAFDKEVDDILLNSSIKYKFYPTTKLDAVFEIKLLSRKEMAKLDKDPQYYPNKKRIWFSWTYIQKKPLIYIDGDNWLYGVPESGLSLSEYRRYVIQHECMHALGYDHQPCTDKTALNKVCPLMYQSTRGCPNGFKCGYEATNADYGLLLR